MVHASIHVHCPSYVVRSGDSPLSLFNQMMVEGVANQLHSGPELQLVQNTGSIGTDGLDAEHEGLCDVLD